MKTVKVIRFCIFDNFMEESKDMHIKASFKDRLKFLLFGTSAVFRFDDEDIMANRTSNKFSIRNTPMKPIDKIGLQKCPRCRRVIVVKGDYCPYCGQKLDWGCRP